MAVLARPDYEPMSSMNTTPMIDVLLVLIVMLIITVPLATHKVTIDLPQAGIHDPDLTKPQRLEIGRNGALSWNGRIIADGELPNLLAAVVRDVEKPLLEMRTDPEARYERFDAVLATVKRANITRLGFVGDAALVRSIGAR